MYVDEAGSGSQWINLDDLTVGDKGDGTLNVTDGGQVRVDGVVKIWNAGTVNIDGGTLEAGGLTGEGSLILSDSGTHTLGNATNSTGIALAGILDVGQATLSLIDADGVDLGSSTTLARRGTATLPAG